MYNETLHKLDNASEKLTDVLMCCQQTAYVEQPDSLYEKPGLKIQQR